MIYITREEAVERLDIGGVVNVIYTEDIENGNFIEDNVSDITYCQNLIADLENEYEAGEVKFGYSEELEEKANEIYSNLSYGLKPYLYNLLESEMQFLF